MSEFAFTPSPARVHELARQRTGHRPVWLYRPYRGELHSIEHFRICSYCKCIHPADLIAILREGRSTFQSTAKPGKYLLTTPNPVAGDLVHMGSMPGRVFDRAPASLKGRLAAATKRGLIFTPSIGERLAGHFETPAFEIAPAMIVWPFYAEHTHERQWREIWDAAAVDG